MLLVSFLFILILGVIGYMVTMASLVAPVPFSPFIFPGLFMAAVIAAIFFAPYARTFLPSSDSMALQARKWKDRILQFSWDFLPYFILLPIVILLFFLPSLQFGYHGLFHSGYIYQILLRGIPPENVTLPGYPTNDYWPYHVYLALISRVLDVPPTFASAFSNVVILGMSCLWVASLWKSLNRRSNTPPAFYVLFPLLGANIFYSFNVKLVEWVSGIAQVAPYADILRAADTRLDISLVRFVNFNGFSVGILFFLVALFVANRMLTDKFTQRDAWLLFLLGTGALLYHVTTGIYLFTVLAPSFVCAYFMDKGHRSFPASTWPSLVKWLLLSGLILLPPGIFLLRAANAMSAKTTVEWFSWTDLSSILVMVYPVSFLFFPGLVKAWKARDIPILFLSFVALWGFLLAIFIKLPDGNEYKFIYLSSVAFGLVAMTRLMDIVSQPGLWRKGLLAFFVVALVFNTGLGTWQFFDMYRRRHKSSITYQGVHVSVAQEDFPPFEWIRENAPLDAVVLQPYTSKDWNYGYFSERLPYVVAGHIYNEGLPESDRRREQLEQLYDTTVSVEAKMVLIQDILHSLGRPLALIYPVDKVFNAAIEKTFDVRGKRIGTTVVYLLSAP
jgi:hypothetical protein